MSTSNGRQGSTWPSTAERPPAVPAPRGAPRTSTDDVRIEAMGRHPTGLGRRLDNYLAAVAQELAIRGVRTGTPQRTDPAHRLIGSIVLDCTALRVAASTPPDDQPADREFLGAAIDPRHPVPVIVTWDEHVGWCVGLHHGPSHSSRRYLHMDLLPAADAVAEFVVGVALGQPLGSVRPPHAHAPGRPSLRVIS